MAPGVCCGAGRGGDRLQGHAGVADALRDLYGSFAELEIEISDYHEAGDRVVGIGRIRTRGKESGAEIVSPYLDPPEALEAAGLSE